jgi:TrmH family RNA methyltransferase
VLTSAKNPKVAAAARLRKRAFREEDRRFLVEGAQGVRAAIETDRLEALFTADDLDPLAVRSRQLGIETLHVSDDVVRRLTSTVSPQALVGVAGHVDVPLGAAWAAMDEDGPGGCIAILHEVRDPGNAGTVVRSADAVGAAGVVFSETSVDPYNPKAVRATAGSIFHLPVVRGVETLSVIRSARQRGARVLAMAAEGATDLYRADLSGRVAFLFGNEAHGLPPAIVEDADAVVRVPQSGMAESLNLAAAASVCLFEWQRRRLRSEESLEGIIAAAAHDIRSPLTAMKGFGYALETRWDAMTEEQRTLMLHGIVHDADRMDTILRQLVDAARVVGGSLETFREQVVLSELVGSVVDSLGRDPDHPPLEWLGEDATVFVDPARLRTALLAFCESLVWWGTEGPIRVDATMEHRTLRLSASRTAALSRDAVEMLFVPRRAGEGSGSKIGLFVARGVAEAQGGRCWANLADGRLVFHIELPAGPG